jgi:hypothetical protein
MNSDITFYLHGNFEVESSAPLVRANLLLLRDSIMKNLGSQYPEKRRMAGLRSSCGSGKGNKRRKKRGKKQRAELRGI